jgi:prevent-host-death family protein
MLLWPDRTTGRRPGTEIVVWASVSGQRQLTPMSGEAYHDVITYVITLEEDMRSHQSIGVRELKEHTTQILRKVRTRGTEIEITYRGQAIARIVPIRRSPPRSAESAAVWTDLDRLAAEISANWPSTVSAVEAVREGRRDL